MPLDPSVRRFLRMLSAGGFAVTPDIDPQEMRAAFVRLAEAIDVKDEPIGRIERKAFLGRRARYRPRLHASIAPEGHLARLALLPRWRVGFLRS